jgi:hypothetical protein
MGIIKRFGVWTAFFVLLFSSCHKERIEMEKKYSGYFTFTYTSGHMDPNWNFIIDTTIVYYGTITSYRPPDVSKKTAYFTIKFRPADEFNVQITSKGAIIDTERSAMSVSGGFSSDNAMWCRWGNFSHLENIEGVRRY